MENGEVRADARDLYRIFRSYIEHEDDLINNRQTWNLTIQGFLFATYAFSLQKLVEAETRAILDGRCYDAASVLRQCTVAEVQQNVYLVHQQGGLQDLRWLLLVIPLVGIGVSVFVWLGIEAARTALTGIRRGWRKDQSGGVVPQQSLDELPPLAGGGSKSAVAFGFYAPRIISWVFIVGWLFLVTVRLNRTVAYAIVAAVPAVWGIYVARTIQGLFRMARRDVRAEDDD